MKKYISYVVVVFILTSLFYSSSCTKETIKTVTLYDTVRIVTNNVTHDTVKIITGMDSVKASFEYSITYSTDSIGVATLKANDASFNVPVNATYNWTVDGISFGTKTYFSIGFWKQDNGNHIISLSITCPDIKKVYNITKPFNIKLKG
jgi:hypothetical protein